MVTFTSDRSFIFALYPLAPVATLRFCHLRPRCVSKQRRTTNVIISDRVWWIWCDAGLATVATRPQRSPHSVASNSRPDYFAATRSRSLFLTINECCVSAAAAAIWEIQWRRSTPQLAPVDTGGHGVICLTECQRPSNCFFLFFFSQPLFGQFRSTIRLP